MRQVLSRHKQQARTDTIALASPPSGNALATGYGARAPQSEQCIESTVPELGMP